MTDVHHDLPSEMSHHEESDVAIGGLFGFAGALAVVLVFVGFVVWLLFSFYAARARQSAPAEFPLAAQQENRLPPEPRLQTNPRQDLSDLRSQEDQILGSYGWVDKNAGVVRIPIEQAMKLTLQRGLPARQRQK
jgi:hypothetical protein